MRMYVMEDYGLSEIAQEMGISRQGVYDAVRRGEAQLMELEQRLGLQRRHRAMAEAARKCLAALERVRARYGDVTPIVSEKSADTDTRFGEAHEFMREMERICDKRVIDSIPKAEPIGPQKLLDVLVIAPCTGSTLARLANGFSDTAVTMAAKAMWRNGRPVVLAVSTNDGLGASAKNIGVLLEKKYVYFVPYGQDDPEKKPTSLVADFTRIPDTIDAALEGRQLQPLLLAAGC